MDWNGFEGKEFEFEEHPALIVFPEKRADAPKLIIQTEYRDAFPETSAELLKRGHFFCFIQNDNRWGTDADIERKARFIAFLLKEYDITGKCVPVGMSCGGIFAVKLAARFPELISCIYLDAPVINYMSCPCGFGEGEPLGQNNSEILNALSLDGLPELLAYRDMPLDNIGKLIENRIPAIIVAGDSDKTVPYKENGAFIEKAYKNTGLRYEVHIKPGCDHHPHGLKDPSAVIEFIEK